MAMQSRTDNYIDIRELIEEIIDNEFEMHQQKLESDTAVRIQTIRDAIASELYRLDTNVSLQLDWLDKQTRILIQHEHEKTSQIRIIAEKVLATAIDKSKHIEETYEPGIRWSDYTTVVTNRTSVNHSKLENGLTMISNIKSTHVPILPLTVIPQSRDIQRSLSAMLTYNEEDLEFMSLFKYNDDVLRLCPDLPQILRRKSAELARLQNDEYRLIQYEIGEAKRQLERARLNVGNRLRRTVDSRKSEVCSQLSRDFSEQERIIAARMRNLTIERTERNKTVKSVYWFSDEYTFSNDTSVEQDSIAESMIEQTKQNLRSVNNVGNAIGYIERNNALKWL